MLFNIIYIVFTKDLGTFRPRTRLELGDNIEYIVLPSVATTSWQRTRSMKAGRGRRSPVRAVAHLYLTPRRARHSAPGKSHTDNAFRFRWKGASTCRWDTSPLRGVSAIALLMRVAIQKLGRGRGIVIPRDMLVQLGLHDVVDLSVQGNSLVLRRPEARPRAEWRNAAQEMKMDAEDAEDMRGFSNLDDDANTW